MNSSSVRSTIRHHSIIAACFIFLLFLMSTRAVAQESILVGARYSSLSVLDLASQKLTETINAGFVDWSVAVGPNPRLAFVGSADYVTVIDLTIGREINRIYGVYGLGMSAFTSDGKFLLLADNSSYSLDVIDAAEMNLVRKVSLVQAMGTGAIYSSLGSVVVVGNNAYVTTIYSDLLRPAIAVVDLKTFTARPIPIPGGYLGVGGYLTPNAAATPDGKYVVMVEDYNSDGSSHLLFISTATNQVVIDNPSDSYDPEGLVITPVSNPEYGYVLGIDPNGEFSATVLDLRNGSPTFGQLLTQTEVMLQSFFTFPTGAAINANGSRLVVGGWKPAQNSPNPNMVVLDTALMLTDPGSAIVGQATVAGGVRPYGIAIASVMTMSPPTAPTVTKVTSSITNDVSNTINIAGTNFAPGALVRLGTMPPLPSLLIAPGKLQVTVPQNAPAHAKLDVIVTNPGTTGPPTQQYQSGLLKGGLTIHANPAFQPRNQFAAFAIGDYSLSIYEPTQGSMINAPTAQYPFGITFNTDGAEIYSTSYGKKGFVAKTEGVAWHPADDSIEAEIPFSGTSFDNDFGPGSISSSVNPATGRPVIYVPVRTVSSGIEDVVVEMVDTDSSSPTFNRVIKTIPAGLNTRDFLQLWAGGAATPDGKYVYVNYYDYYTGEGEIAIFDVVKGTVTTIGTDTLGVAPFPSATSVTADGQSLLMTGSSSNPKAGPIAVLDIGKNPKNPVPVATITGSPLRLGNATPFDFISWQVVGSRLFALELYRGAIVTFNFDRIHSNFSQMSVYGVPNSQNLGTYIAVSPDGSLVYVPVIDYDMITVLDASSLASGQPSLITNIGAFRAPVQVAVSQVAYQGKR